MCLCLVVMCEVIVSGFDMALLGEEPHPPVALLVRAVQLRPHGVAPAQHDLLELRHAHPTLDGEAALGKHLWYQER